MPDATKPDYTALDLPAPPAGRPYVLVNMVMSLDGKIAIEGTERGLGSDADQRLMRELRVNADIVLNGAGTLRASGTSPRTGDEALEQQRIASGRTRHPIAAVLSRTGELPLDRAFFTARDFEAVIYLSSAAPAERREALVATGRAVHTVAAGDEVAAMLGHMRRELGATVVLVEGGPHLNGALFEQGFVDEIFLTLGPVVAGGTRQLTAVESATEPTRARLTRMRLVSAVPNAATSEVYLRYQRGDT